MGGSFYILLDKDEVEIYNIHENDIVEIELSRNLSGESKNVY